jgi:hypothetical protein
MTGVMSTAGASTKKFWGETASLLQQSRDRLARPRGWIKGVLEDDRGGCCAVGVLWRCGNAVASRQAAIDLLADEIPGRPTGARRVQDFNDARSTRKKDVLALFDRAIARANEKAGV